MDKTKLKGISYRLFMAKWILIALILFITVFTSIFFVYNSLSAKNIREKIITENEKRKSDLYLWYEDLPMIRGTTEDDKSFFLFKINLAYPQKNGEKIGIEIFNKRYVIIDVLLNYFSHLNSSYLSDAENRTTIKYSIMEEINEVLSFSISDIAFTNFSIENL